MSLADDQEYERLWIKWFQQQISVPYYRLRNLRSTDKYWTPKLCAMFLRTNDTFEPGSVSETFVGRFERFARYLYFRLLWRWKNSTVEREYSKTKKQTQEIDNETHT